MPDTLPDTYPPPPPEECRYCGGEVRQVSQKEFYGQSYGGGSLYVCYECNARVGTHDGSSDPLGLLANQELLDLRKKVHELFDPMWRENGTSRQEAYEFFFGSMLGLPEHRQHVGMLTKEECEKAIRILED